MLSSVSSGGQGSTGYGGQAGVCGSVAIVSPPRSTLPHHLAISTMTLCCARSCPLACSPTENRQARYGWHYVGGITAGFAGHGISRSPRQALDRYLRRFRRGARRRERRPTPQYKGLCVHGRQGCADAVTPSASSVTSSRVSRRGYHRNRSQRLPRHGRPGAAGHCRRWLRHQRYQPMLLAERSSRSTSQEQIGVTLDANLLLELPARRRQGGQPPAVAYDKFCRPAAPSVAASLVTAVSIATPRGCSSSVPWS